MRIVLTFIILITVAISSYAQHRHHGVSNKVSGSPSYMKKAKHFSLDSSSYNKGSANYDANLNSSFVYTDSTGKSNSMLYHSKTPCIIPDSSASSNVITPKNTGRYSLQEKRVIFDEPNDIKGGKRPRESTPTGKKSF
ncbi:MAG: hypothetical protein MI922_29440 [Bacteroidales bacterium]|nr:hypothetical protein [Bacteroidales bacterium]